MTHSIRTIQQHRFGGLPARFLRSATLGFASGMATHTAFRLPDRNQLTPGNADDLVEAATL